MELFKFKKQRGFTLVEMLISMAIFVAFTGILINSYTSIVKSQRDANNYRVMYTEARKVFDTLVQELRDGMVDYNAYNGVPVVGGLSEIYLVSKDAAVKTQVRFEADQGRVSLSKSKKDSVTGAYGPFSEFSPLNSAEVNVSDFKFYVSPSIDPYNIDYVNFDANQFQPKVTIYARFERELDNGKTFEMDLQTTVSSRVYNQIYKSEL